MFKSAGNKAATGIVQTIVNLLHKINATQMTIGGGGEDIGYWQKAGVPGGSLLNDNQNYFDFHHSNGNYFDISLSTLIVVIMVV